MNHEKKQRLREIEDRLSGLHYALSQKEKEYTLFRDRLSGRIEGLEREKRRLVSGESSRSLLSVTESARELAAEEGVDLEAAVERGNLQPSGNDGRVIKVDVQRFLKERRSG